MKLIILFIAIAVIILLLKNIETFQSENDNIVKIGDNIINMINDDVVVINNNDINWQKDSVDAKLGSNISLDLIYMNNTVKMNSSGKIDKYYNSNLLNLYSKDNELKQIMITKNKSTSYFLKVYNSVGNILYSTPYDYDWPSFYYWPNSYYNYWPRSYYYPTSYPRIPYKHDKPSHPSPPSHSSPPSHHNFKKTRFH